MLNKNKLLIISVTLFYLISTTGLTYSFYIKDSHKLERNIIIGASQFCNMISIMLSFLINKKKIYQNNISENTQNISENTQNDVLPETIVYNNLIPELELHMPELHMPPYFSPVIIPSFNDSIQTPAPTPQLAPNFEKFRI